MKKTLSFVLALALVLTVVAPVAASAQTTASTFTTNLKVGARGAAVTALQQFLISKGTLAPQYATGYFGSLTKKAVIAYQTTKGLPATGYFGPMSRAAANAEGTTTTTTTGGTTTTTPVTTSGVEGSLDVRLAATPASNQDIQTSTDVPVLGFELRGKIADVVIQTLDLKTSVTANSSTENPGTLINTIKVWDGSTVLATVPVNLSTFTKDSNQEYYVRISGLNFVVPKDATKVLTVTFSTNSMDTSRTVVVSGYGSTGLRAVSGNGVSSFYSTSGISLTHTFKKPGDSTLTVANVSTPLRSSNNKIQTSSGAKGVSVLNFTVKSETGNSVVTTIYASTTASGTMPTTLYLYDGSTLVASKPAASNVVFDNLTVGVTKDTIKTLSVKADWGSDAVNSSVATTTIQTVKFDKPTGASATVSSSVSGVGHYVYTGATQFALAGTPTITVQNSSVVGASSSMNANFPVSITAQGGDWIRSSASAIITWTKANNPSGSATTTVAAISRIDNIGDNSNATVNISAGIQSNDPGITAGEYIAKITSITWKIGSNATVTQTYGLEDFLTPPSSTLNK